MRYMTKFCDQTKMFDFLSDSGVWVMSYGFWVWVIKTEYWDMKTKTPLNQMGLYSHGCSKETVNQVKFQLFIYHDLITLFSILSFTWTSDSSTFPKL